MLVILHKMTFFEKFSLYSLSMWPFYLVVFLLSAQKPGSDVEMSWEEALCNNWPMPIISFVLFWADIAIYIYFVHYDWSGTTQSPITIEEIEHKGNDYITFVASFVVPIVSFALAEHPLRHGAVLLTVFVLIGILYIRNDQYFANPTLGLAGYKLYRVSGSTASNQKKANIMVFTQDALTNGDAIEYRKISDTVFYAEKV